MGDGFGAFVADGVASLLLPFEPPPPPPFAAADDGSPPFGQRWFFARSTGHRCFGMGSFLAALLTFPATPSGGVTFFDESGDESGDALTELATHKLRPLRPTETLKWLTATSVASLSSEMGDAARLSFALSMRLRKATSLDAENKIAVGVGMRCAPGDSATTRLSRCS